MSSTHQLIDQALNSWDLRETIKTHPELTIAAFRPRSRFEEEPEQFLIQRQYAQDADIMFCTSVSVIIDQRLQGDYNGAVNRDVIIFDEADQLPQFAALAADVSISREELRASR